MQKLGIRLLRTPVPQSRPLPSEISDRADGRVLEWPTRNPPHRDRERGSLAAGFRTTDGRFLTPGAGGNEC